MRVTDIDRTIYQIQFRASDARWYTCADHILDDNPTRLGDKPWSCTNGFHASGECWQETGIHGTYDLEYARRCLKRVRERDDKGWTFRIVRRRIVQKIEALQEETWA